MVGILHPGQILVAGEGVIERVSTPDGFLSFAPAIVGAAACLYSLFGSPSCGAGVGAGSAQRARGRRILSTNLVLMDAPHFSRFAAGSQSHRRPGPMDGCKPG